MSNVKIQKVISVGGRKFATVEKAADFIATSIGCELTYNLVHTKGAAQEVWDEEHRLWVNKLKHLTNKARRRVTPILERALREG